MRERAEYKSTARLVGAGVCIRDRLEAVRRTTGWALVIIIAVFLAYAMGGDAMPGRLAGRASDWQKLAG